MKVILTFLCAAAFWRLVFAVLHFFEVRAEARRIRIKNKKPRIMRIKKEDLFYN